MNKNHRTSLRGQFLLDKDITFLNHGSFGATPRPVFRAYQRYQLELEREPVDFLGRRAPALLEQARAPLAHYLGVGVNDLVYITNATQGINIVARSLDLRPGDEVLATDHEYGAIDRTWHFLAKKSGFTYTNRAVPLPVTTPEEWVERFWAGVNPRTRVISISHITSPTALIWPIREICHRARQIGILTVIDGAHAPGQIPLDLLDLQVDFYAGNLHKWLCAPKGSAFLYAHPSVQSRIEPLIVSWGYESDSHGPSTFIDYNQWTGTRDIAAFLSVPDALRYLETHHWDRERRRCHNLALRCAQEINAITGLESLSPVEPAWFAQMVAVRLPDRTDPPHLARYLWEDRRIEVPLIDWNGQKLIRVSFQAYNDDTDLSHLCVSLKDYYSAR